MRLLNCDSVTSSRKADKTTPLPLLLANIGQLLTLQSSSGRPGPRRGRAQSARAVLKPLRDGGHNLFQFRVFHRQ